MHDDPDFSSSLYLDRTFNARAVKLLPGEYHATAEDLLLVTVLGSCVAVCIRDYIRNIGGMNHFMLPGSGVDPRRNVPSARYGDRAVTILLEQILRLGGRREHLEAKLFGGGRVINAMTDVGQNNVACARALLCRLGIPLAAEDVGDIHPRKVYFYPATGRVLVRRLRSSTVGQADRATDTLYDIIIPPPRPLTGLPLKRAGVPS